MTDQDRLIEALQLDLQTAASALHARTTMRRWRDGEAQLRIAVESIAHAHATWPLLRDRLAEAEEIIREHNHLEEVMYDTGMEAAWPKDAEQLQRVYEQKYGVDLSG
jgi:hypothetical protein